MRDGLKIYACSGFGVGTAPAEFTYWLDNTNTLTNTCAVNSLLSDINFVAAKLQYDTTLTSEDVVTALNMIDLYTVCLYGAEEYHAEELARYGRIVAAMVADGRFANSSTDNNERDAYLDELIAEANTRFADGEDYEGVGDTWDWFYTHVLSLDYVGLTEAQREDVRNAMLVSPGVSGTTEQDAAVALTDSGAYYLYTYMSPEQARKIGKVVYAKRRKETEVYNYVLDAYIEFYGSKEAVDKLIYTGICKQYKSTPEAVVRDLTNKSKGVGELAVIIGIIASIVTILSTVLSIVLTICGAALQAKYQEPDDPDFGTPGLDGADIDEIKGYSDKVEDGKGLLGLLAAAALVLCGIFR